MALRSVVVLILAASVAEIAVVGHEVLKTKGTARDMAIARRMMPLDAANDLMVAANDGAANESSLRAAVEKNPYDSESWISLSVGAEMRGDASSAERYLQAAAAHNIGREPKWALTNFYFRQGNQARFLEWANRYRSVSRVREDGLFRMVAETVPDAHGLIASLPNLSCDEYGTAIDVFKSRQEPANELMDTMSSNCHDPSSQATLKMLVGELLMKDETTRAGQVWQQMGFRTSLSNPDFEDEITGQGFDWHFNESPSVEFRQRGRSGLVFDLGDRVASGTVLLFQPVLLAPGVKYRLVMNAESSPSALEYFHWELVELSSGVHLPSDLDGEDINQQNAWEFKAPFRGDKTMALALFYRRPEGSEPFNGRLTVHGVHLVRELGTSGTPSMLAVRSHAR